MGLNSNDILSDVSVIRSRHQNGSCSSNGASVLHLKWKPRNVSVVRDFPPGCGPIAQLVSVGSDEANPSSSLVKDNNGANDTVTAETQVQSLSHDVSKSTEDGKMGLIVDLHKELQNGDEKAMLKDEISAPVNAVIEVDDNGGGVIKESPQKLKFPQRRVSAVRKFPPYCGLNATEPTKEERIRINGKRRFGIEDKGGGRSAKLTDSTVVGGEESNGNVKDDVLNKTQANESKESLMANQDPMGDKSDISSQIASQIIEKVCQDLVVYSRDNDQKKRSLVDACDEDSEENLEDESFHQVAQVVKPIRSVAPIQEKVKKVNDQRKKVSHKKDPTKRPLDDINIPGFIKGERSIVLGLMAPSFCPKVIPSITPTMSKSEKVKVPEESSNYMGTVDKGMAASLSPKATPSITPKKSKSKKVKVPKESSSYTGTVDKDMAVSLSPEVTPSITPKKSKSKKVKVSKESSSYTGTVDKDMAVSLSPKATPSITPKKSKSKKIKVSKESSTYSGKHDMVVKDEEPSVQETEEQGEELPNSHEVEVTLPPFGPRSSNSARNRIRETLRLFQHLCRKLLQGEEAKISEDDESKHILTGKRVDLTVSRIIQQRGKAPDRGKKTYGSIPGVEVGDEFQYRVELALIGLHWVLQGGIDYIKFGKTKIPVAVSVVASGGYDNEINKPECLIYSGSGGIGKDKVIEDQKLERGNVALKNNIELKIPVRVIRGYKGKPTEPSSSKTITTTYIYDGLYTVEDYRQEKGPLGNMVFKFELKRIPGQPELALREVKSKKFKIREGLCINDITNGKEKIRISAVNTINDEKPPSFNYITKIVYPDWYRDCQPVPPTGCDCVGRCSDKRCKCAAKNGGEVPYNHNGLIVEAKPLVYECGPACKCPPSCYNRVTQNGMKIQLEIFKTESRGWGVRSLNSISSGSFICEYVGEFLEDTEAEKRTGNDEYLFDIGQNYSDMGMGTEKGTGGFTIDALNYGNVGRFINHSCSPNLYAQNVLYDQDDKRMPHIMLFAAENIPPLQELTYHYNYAVDTVHDSDGNIKVKKCFCGSPECTGRLY